VLPPPLSLEPPWMVSQPWAQGSGHRLAHHLQDLAGVQRARLLLDLGQRLLLHLALR